MNSLIKYGLIAAAVVGFYLYNSSQDGGAEYAGQNIDLNAVLDVTVETIYAYEDSLQGLEEKDPDKAFLGFTGQLGDNFNAATPPLHDKKIGTNPQNDASVLAFEDINDNNTMDEGETALFLVEIDGENSRVIASGNSGAINEHRFSGTGLLAGYLIGSMLSRQRASGASSSVASKKPISASQAARTRAGSGSHSKGK